MEPIKVNGTKESAPHYVVDELDYLKRLYTKEQIEELWESAKPKINGLLKDYKPYIVYLGAVDGTELYQVNGDNNFFYITNKAGAEKADKALRKAAEEYWKGNDELLQDVIDTMTPPKELKNEYEWNVLKNGA